MVRRRILGLALVASCLGIGMSIGLMMMMETRPHQKPVRTGQRTPPSPLHAAAREGDFERVRTLITSGADIDAKDPYHGETPLQVAASGQHAEIVAFLIDHGADIDVVGSHGTALHRAASLGRMNTARLLVDRGADVNTRDRDGETALHRAARQGHFEVAAMLAAHGADLEAERPDGYTPMHLALHRREKEIAEMLIDRGANVRVRALDGETPLHDAARLGDRDLVERLMAAELDVNAQSNRFVTPLLAAVEGMARAESDEHNDVIESLVTAGADVNVQNLQGDTPLLMAATRGRLTLAEFLIAHDADVNAANRDGHTPLIRAIRHSDPAILELLIANGADINARTGDHETVLILATTMGNKTLVERLIAGGAEVDALGGNLMGTALHYAAERGFTPIAQNLLDAGANVNIPDGAGRTPTALAADVNHRNLVAMLVNRGAAVTIHLAAYLGDIETIEKFVEADVDLDAADELGRTPLHLATEQGHRPIAALLVAGGAEVDARDQYGRTPLFLAATRGAEDMVRMLADGGADVNAADRMGRIGLHMASWRGHLDLVHLLIDRGANVDAQTTLGYHEIDVPEPRYYAHSGWTPLQAAADNDHEDVMRLLIAHGATASIWQAVQAGALDAVQSLIAGGADVNVRRTPADKTLLHQAARRGHADVAAFLLAKGADPNAGGWYGRTPLHDAAQAGCQQIAELLLRHGAFVDATDDGDCTPLAEAAIYDCRDVAQCLLDHGAAIDKTSTPGRGQHWLLHSPGWTPLHGAAAMGNEEIAELLLARGADVNAKDRDASMPLHQAAFYGHTTLVGLLVGHGADRDARTRPLAEPPWDAEPSRTPLDHAREGGFADTVAALGGDPNDPALAGKGPYSVIITEAQGLRQFLWFEGIDFEDVWVPTPADLNGLDAALRSFLQANRNIRARTYFHREYVLAHLRRYNREYSGFIKDGTRRIICQMHLMGDFSREASDSGFTIIFDGCCAVVRVVFDAMTGTVIEIDCNGGA
ncbi:ankyrin repeat domain-containing protein [Anaerobaca lacustris]|uniref:Ankyrin repeat domain-containing protein n=1 Tax=Anaerobaca lacustris TaxID=3044600 RepID=A0AAW6TP95_9BACT|nr:ankyrin repeat domain-containing protein [Sedimentisphaerales bacterium M17dextr]